jgi:hypothetical protein
MISSYFIAGYEETLNKYADAMQDGPATGRAAYGFNQVKKGPDLSLDALKQKKLAAGTTMGFDRPARTPMRMAGAAPTGNTPAFTPRPSPSAGGRVFDQMAAMAPSRQQNVHPVMAPQRSTAPQQHPKNLNAPGMESERAKYSPSLIAKWNAQYQAKHPGAGGGKGTPAATGAQGSQQATRMPTDLFSGQSQSPFPISRPQQVAQTPKPQPYHLVSGAESTYRQGA